VYDVMINITRGVWWTWSFSWRKYYVEM